MSKRYGNVVNPDDVVKTYGADTLRLYEMFMGPFNQSVAWSTESIIGPRRFIEKVWRIQNNLQPTTDNQQRNKELESILHQTIKKVSEDIESMGFNTAVSQMMILANAMERAEHVSQDDYELFLRILAPFAPHITEELWHMLGHKKSIHLEPWPMFDSQKLVAHEIKIPVQVNGKLRGVVLARKDVTESEVILMACALPEIQKWIQEKEIVRTIYVPGKLLNFVVR